MGRVRDDEFEFNVRLIQLVRQQPALYDKSRSDHYKARIREQIWEKLKNELNYTGSAISLRNQWTGLRDYYIKEKREGHLEGEENTWPCFPYLTWLDEYVRDLLVRTVFADVESPTKPITDRCITKYAGMQRQRRKAGISSKAIKPPVVELGDDQMHHDEQRARSSPMLSWAPTMPSFNIDPIERLPPPEAILSEGRSEVPTAEELFCRSIGIRLAALPEPQKSLAQLQIQQVFFDITKGGGNLVNRIATFTDL